MSHEPVPIHMGSPRFRSVNLPGLQVSEVWFPSGLCLDRHTHERPVFAVAVEGVIHTRIGSRTVDDAAPAVWTEPAGEAHSNRVGQEGARVLTILPDPEAEQLEWLGNALFDDVLAGPHAGLASLARRIILEIEDLDEPGRLTVHGLALECLAVGYRFAGERRSRRSREAWIEDARELIHERFHEGLTLAQIAEELGVEARRLARAFRSRFKMPIGSYQRRRRLEWARRRLVESDDPLSLIALQAGFYDQAHFTRQFRRQTGETPGRFRSRFRRI